MADDEDDFEDAGDEASPQPGDRDEELCQDPDIRKECVKIFDAVEKGFEDQWNRANSQLDYWDIYNCVLGPEQFYSGNSKIFAPLVHDAIEARVTRFTNQVFPISGRHIEVFASEDKPMETQSLLEFYIRKAKLRTKIVPALLRNGDVEGQYNLYISWTKTQRRVAYRIKTKPKINGEENPEADDIDTIQEQTITHSYPRVEVLNDMDVLILPNTADSIDDAIESGGSYTVLRRWSKYKVRKLIREGELDKEEGQALLREMGGKRSGQQPDKRKAMADAAGIKGSGEKKTAHIYETWAKLKVDGEYTLCRLYYGGESRVIGCKRNPNWDDKVPGLSVPVNQLEGSIKGQSKVKFVATYQYAANDFINESMDSATFSLMPIVMTDPLKNPRVSSMVLNVAAIWETSPNDTKFAQFPQLWKDGVAIVGGFKDQIFQTLGVNPAMIPQAATSGGKKPNQAAIANEQQVDILTTADAVTILEGGILTPLLMRFYALDHQHRDKSITIRAFGEMGLKANMQMIEPVQMGRRFELRWYGVEQARNQQMMQTQMATLNVLRGLGPQDTPGYEKDLSPIIMQIVENTYGARIAPLIFKDVRKRMTLEAAFENDMLKAGYYLSVHPMDDDQSHMQEHFKAYQESEDPHGTIREHIVRHQMQMQQKQQAMMAQQAQILQGGQQGMPGGAGPGVPGTPRQGAAPAGPRPQGPPGMVHADRMPNRPPRLARG